MLAFDRDAANHAGWVCPPPWVLTAAASCFGWRLNTSPLAANAAADWRHDGRLHRLCRVDILMLALIARPISRLWLPPLHYRRALGGGAFVLSLVHTFMLEHTLQWNFTALSFLLPMHCIGRVYGISIDVSTCSHQL